MTVQPVPEGYRTVTPYLFAREAASLIEFLKQGFAAEEVRRTLDPEGSIMNAEVKIGDSPIMVSEAKGECLPMASSIYLYVEDTDATYKQALNAGATPMTEPKDEFWGDRYAAVKDPSGNCWMIATHQEDLSDLEIDERIAALFAVPDRI